MKLTYNNDDLIELGLKIYYDNRKKLNENELEI